MNAKDLVISIKKISFLFTRTYLFMYKCFILTMKKLIKTVCLLVKTELRRIYDLLIDSIVFYCGNKD